MELSQENISFRHIASCSWHALDGNWLRTIGVWLAQSLFSIVGNVFVPGGQLVAGLLLKPMDVGFQWFCLATARGEEASGAMLFRPYGRLFRYLWAYIRIAIFVIFWLLLSIAAIVLMLWLLSRFVGSAAQNSSGMSSSILDPVFRLIPISVWK